MVLHEIEQLVQYVVLRLPLATDTLGRPALAGHAAQVVVHADLVVQVVHTRSQVVAVQRGVVALGDEEHLLVSASAPVRHVLAHLRDDPCEELHGHHLRHVHAEAVHAAVGPVEEYIPHLEPRVGNGVELLLHTALVEDAVVQLHGLVPVVMPGVGAEAVVAGGLGGELAVVADVERGRESLAGEVIEVIERREGPLGVVVLAQVAHARRLAQRLVLARHMVRHEVDEHLQSGAVGACDQCLKLGHTLRLIHRQVRVHVVVVGDGIGTAGLALDDSGAVMLGRGVAYDARVPYVRSTQVAYRAQGFGVDVLEAAAAVLNATPVILTGLAVVTEQTRQQLIDNRFQFGRFLMCVFRGIAVRSGPSSAPSGISDGPI